MRYGYRRTAMDDIARHVGVSRPSLYLTFPSKEAIFRDVVAMGHDELLHNIEAGLPAQRALSEKLTYAFELWSVQTFDMVMLSPAASELMSDSYDFASDLFEQAAQRLADMLADAIRAAVAKPASLRPAAEAQARIMIAAAHGFKSAARNTDDMRTLIQDLVRMTVAGLPIKA